MNLIIIAHLVNIVVAGSVGTLLLLNHASMVSVFGDATPARSILLTMYLAIALMSLIALITPSLLTTITLVLFSFQILYKVSTLATVGFKNPVVWCNVAISVLLFTALLQVVGMG